MEIEEALNRLYWRFGGNGNKYPFPVNQNDVDAFNVIKNFVVDKQEKQLKNNELFAKMYIQRYQAELKENQTTIYDISLRKEMHKFLEKSLNQVIEEFTASLNESEQYKFIEEAGVELKHPIIMTETETEIRNKKLAEAINNPEAKKRFLGQVWDYKTVANCLNAEVNQAINKFKK